MTENPDSQQIVLRWNLLGSLGLRLIPTHERPSEVQAQEIPGGRVPHDHGRTAIGFDSVGAVSLQAHLDIGSYYHSLFSYGNLWITSSEVLIRNARRTEVFKLSGSYGV